jgi:THO complex subunit 2
MEQVHKDYETKVKERISGAKISQLAMAAPLEAASTSSSSSKARPSTPAEPKKPAETPDIPPQKVGLLSALLAVGALQPAIAIMSKFPWVVDAYPEIADLMIRVMKHSISPLYESTMVTKERNRSFTQPRARYGAGGVSVPPSRKAQLTLWAPTPPSTHTIDFVFFFPDWALRVPLCSSLDDLVDIIEPLMRFIGLHISRDPLFVTKFTRLGRTHLISTVNKTNLCCETCPHIRLGAP